jgi:DNA transformation protein
MGFSAEYRARIEETLSEIVPIRTRAMFGGVGIYASDLFFALIAEDRLYFKVDDTNRSDFESMGMSPFYPYDSTTPMHYWELPGSVLSNPIELAVWIDKAIAVAARKKKR